MRKSYKVYKTIQIQILLILDMFVYNSNNCTIKNIHYSLGTKCEIILWKNVRAEIYRKKNLYRYEMLNISLYHSSIMFFQGEQES